MEISESTDAIRNKILSDTEKEAQRLKVEAQDKASGIVKAAGERAKQMKEAELEQRKKHMDETIRQTIAEAKVDHHRRIQTFKLELIENAFNKARKQLQDYVKTPAYQKTLNDLIKEAGVALGGGDLLIKLNETDRKTMKKKTLEDIAKEVKEKTGTETKIVLDKSGIKSIGGVILLTADQKSTIDNTFESRLDRIKEEAITELETILLK